MPKAEARVAALQHEMQRLAGQLFASCTKVCDAREEIRRIRRESIDSINQELSTLRLTFQRSANHSRRDSLAGAFQEASSFLGFMDSYTGEESYEKLRELFRTLMSLEAKEESWKVKELLWDAKFIELLGLIDDDDVNFEFEVGNAGFVPIQNLSAGQRCTAVFPLLLRNTRGPLVIDQPEDNLDNRYIANTIAPDLLIKKQHQQFIATSHNANLVVLTDADLVIHADSDGTVGSLPGRGFFACAGSSIGTAILDVLDGGEHALRARQHKYGTLRA